MSVFNKGDVVKRRPGFGHNGVRSGDQHVVDMQQGNTLILVGQVGSFSADRFELVQDRAPGELRIGDRVRRRPDTGQSQNVQPGNEYTVNFVSNNGLDIGVDVDNGTPAGNHFTSNFDFISAKFVMAMTGKTSTGRMVSNQPALQNLPKTEGAYNPNIGHTTDGGGLQQHSIGGPFPFVLVGIENPTGLKPGTYWYVQDKTGIRCTIHFRKCESAATHAAKLVTSHPDGVAHWPIPPLSASEGYVNPNVTITMTREEAEAVSVAMANLCIPGTDIVTNVLALLRAQGIEWKEVTKTFARGFESYGDTLNCEIEPGRLKPSGSLTLARRVKL